MSIKYTVNSLKQICKDKGIKRYSKLRKDELIKYCVEEKTLEESQIITKKTKTKPGAKFGVVDNKLKKAQQIKQERLKRKKQLIKRKFELEQRRKEKIKEREERKMDTPVKEDRTKQLLQRLTNFIKEMNSTNEKRKVLKKYDDLKEFIRYVFDPENEFGITSEDYKEFKESGRKKRIKNPYVDIFELLEDLEDYKEIKALLHLYHFIEIHKQYENLILHIIDKKLPIKQGPVKSLKASIKKDEKESLKKINNTKDLLNEVEKMVFEINKTNKTNIKQTVLENYKHLKKIIKYVYDPDLVFGVTSKRYLKYEESKKPKPEILGSFIDIYKLLDALAERKLTGNSALLNIYHFIQHYRIHKNTILNILDKSLKIRLNKSTINEVFPRLISTFEPTLAQKFDQKILDKTKEDWYISQKLDGVRCIILVNKKDKKVKSFSRTGKVFTTLGKLEESILKHIDEFDGNYMLDGEIIEESEGKEDFTKIMEVIKRKNYTIQDPKYRLFDMIPLEVFAGRKKGEILSVRYKKSIEMFGKARVNHIRVLKQSLFTKEKFEKMKTKANKKHWEGLMVRRDTHYKIGRTKDLLKVKHMHDDEFKVVGIEEGTKDILNKITRKMETKKIMSAVYINYNNVKVGSGFTDKERLYYIEHPEEIIGKVITVQYFEKTEKSLRFPIFKILHGTKRDI